MNLNSPLKLPNGVVLPNRLAKAAWEENVPLNASVAAEPNTAR